MVKVAFSVEKSENKKTGPVSATYASQKSCPSSCPFRESGCYAETGPLGIFTARLNAASKKQSKVEIARQEAAAIDSLTGERDLRVHVVGDADTKAAASIISSAMARHRAKRGKAAWTYTHSWRKVPKAAWGEESVLASMERVEDIKEARTRGYAAALVVEKFQENGLHVVDGEKILPCPNQTRGKTCVECRLCMKAETLREKGITIAFEAHGTRKKLVNIAIKAKKT